MALKVVEYTVQEEGRDQGKTFVITEMPARKAARWATKVLTALINSGMSISPEMASTGVAGLAALGLGFSTISRLRYEDAQALQDELLACVMWRSDPTHPNVLRPLGDDALEEMTTVFLLVKEAFNLHTSFLRAAAPSTSTQGSEAAA
jgi:hypothetical protein